MGKADQDTRCGSIFSDTACFECCHDGLVWLWHLRPRTRLLAIPPLLNALWLLFSNSYWARPSSSPQHAAKSLLHNVSIHKTVRVFEIQDCYSLANPKQVLDAPDLASLAGDTLALKKAMAFASACGAFTTTRPGAISAQPSLGEAQALFETSEKWYNFW